MLLQQTNTSEAQSLGFPPFITLVSYNDQSN